MKIITPPKVRKDLQELIDLSENIIGSNTDLIYPWIRHILREIIYKLDKALPLEVEPD
jgi:hypothetical protein